MVKKIKITIDGREVMVKEWMTILEAAREQNIHIPTLCHHPALSSWGGCRLCVVQVDGSPKLAASCVTPVRDGMDIVTNNETILESRRTVLEFIFSERNHNCMFCPKSGECELQKLAYELQMDHLTVSPSFDEFPTDITSEYMGIDHNRCVLCGRCVRACHEISGARVLNFINRGPESLIGLDLNTAREDSVCFGCGACIQVCPTGAIFNRYRSHYAVKGHRTDWGTVESVCPQCGLLCPAVFYTQDNNLIKVEGFIDTVADTRPDRGQLCRKLRFDALKNSGSRIIYPLIKNTKGDWVEKGWDDALDVTARKLRAVRDKEGETTVLGFISPNASNEELVLFRDFMQGSFGNGSTDTLDGEHYRTIKGAWRENNTPLKESDWELIPEADFILLAGADPKQTQPAILPIILKSIYENKTYVVEIGENSSLKPYAEHHIPVLKAEHYSAVFDYLNQLTPAGVDAGKGKSRESKQEKIPKGLKSLDKRGAITRELRDVAEAFNNSVNPLIIVGDKITSLHSPDALQGAVKLAMSKGLLAEDAARIIILKPGGNSAAAWELGMASEKEPAFGKKLKASVIVFSEERELKGFRWDRFKGAEFLAVITPFISKEMQENVDVVIPKPIWLEEDGTFTSLDGSVERFKNKILTPPEGVMDTWLTLTKLTERMGLSGNVEKLDAVSRPVKGSGRKTVHA